MLRRNSRIGKRVSGILETIGDPFDDLHDRLLVDFRRHMGFVGGYKIVRRKQIGAAELDAGKQKRAGVLHRRTLGPCLDRRTFATRRRRHEAPFAVLQSPFDLGRVQWSGTERRRRRRRDKRDGRRKSDRLRRFSLFAVHVQFHPIEPPAARMSISSSLDKTASRKIVRR